MAKEKRGSDFRLVDHGIEQFRTDCVQRASPSSIGAAMWPQAVRKHHVLVVYNCKQRNVMSLHAGPKPLCARLNCKCVVNQMST